MPFPRRVTAFLLTLLTVSGMIAMFGAVNVGKPVHASDIAFGSLQNLSNDQAVSEEPHLATSGSYVYAIWLNNTAGNPDILFKASSNDGTSFGQVVNLSNNPTGFSSRPEIATSGNNVYVLWEDNVTGNEDVWFRASANNGASFGNSMNLSTQDTRDSLFPQLAASGTNVFVTWQNEVTGSCGSGCTPYDIFFRNSTNSGTSFISGFKNLSNDKVSTTPVIAATGNNVWVAWQDTNGGRNDIFLRSTTNGFTTSQLTNLSQNPLTSPQQTSSVQQQISASGSNVYAVWYTDSSTSADDVFFSVSTNSGASFTGPANLSNNAFSTFPQLSSSGSNVHVVWENHTGAGPPCVCSSISYRGSTNAGTGFSTAINLSGVVLEKMFTNAQVASSGTNVYATWQDDSDVFFKSSSDNGTSFGSIQNLSNNSGFSTNPAIAAGNGPFVAWQDDTVGNSDILFKAGAVKTTFKLNAFAATGWNSTNPSLTVFKGKAFTIMIIWKDSPAHDFAVYTKAFPAGSVNTGNTCSLSNSNGCLAKSSDVTSASASTIFTFTPTIPPNDFTGPGQYEYYCQYHPTTMHGTINVYKIPDVDGDGTVTILDIATVAFYFGLSQPTWASGAITVDFNNDGMISILDVAFAAFYFGKTL